MTRGMLLPLAAVLALAGVFGLWLGVASAPMTESEVIERYAAEYVTETGGERTDCYAVPAGVEGVWMIVICEAEGSEAWFRAVDARGDRVLDEVVFGEDET